MEPRMWLNCIICCMYSISLSLPSVGKLSWRTISKFRKRNKIFLSLDLVLHSMWNYCSHATQIDTEMYKKAWCKCKDKTYCFLMFLLTTTENTITYHKCFVSHCQNLHKHCLQFLLGVKMAPGETENNAYAKFWSD